MQKIPLAEITILFQDSHVSIDIASSYMIGFRDLVTSTPDQDLLGLKQK